MIYRAATVRERANRNIHVFLTRPLLKDNATFSGILLFSGLRPVAALFFL
jgi:hypothetical protein